METTDLRHKLIQEQKGACYVCGKYEWELDQPMVIREVKESEYILICQDCHEGTKDQPFDEYKKKRKTPERQNQEEYTPAGNQRFSIVPYRAVYDMSISDAQFRTLAALGVFGDVNGWCWPSLEKLGKIRHKSKSAISQDITALKKAEYLQVIPHYEDDGTRSSNDIRIIFDYGSTTTTEPKRGFGKRKTEDINTMFSLAKHPVNSELNTLLTPGLNVNATNNDTDNDIAPKNGASGELPKTPSSQKKQTTGTKTEEVQGVSQNERTLDFLPSGLRPLGDAFIEKAGAALLPTKAERSGWCKFLNEWASLKFTPELVQAAVEKMRRDNLTISGPQSITKVARSIMALQVKQEETVWRAGMPWE